MQMIQNRVSILERLRRQKRLGDFSVFRVDRVGGDEENRGCGNRRGTSVERGWGRGTDTTTVHPVELGQA